MDKLIDATHQVSSEGLRKARDWIAAGPKGILIGGTWSAARSGETFTTLDPATGEALADVAAAGAADVAAAVDNARRAFDGHWARLDPYAREAQLHRLADILERNVEELVTLQSLDMGTLLSTSRRLVQGAAAAFRYYAGFATKITGQTFPPRGSSFTYTRREPLGVVGAIIPWNGPAQATAWKIAPALACGNTVVFKPAEQAPLVPLRMMELFGEAGLPEGVVNMVPGLGEVAGAALVEHPGVAKITFTGSTATGRSILRAAAATLKKVTLELGGKSPTIIFPDADLDRAIPAAVLGFTAGAGQACVAGSRILVHASIHDEIVSALSSAIGRLKVGSAFKPGTEIPPIISQRQLDRVNGFIDDGKEQGAVVAGGNRHAGPGFYAMPTVFSRVQPEMRIVREEIFGPVGTVMPFRDEAEAIRIANDTEFGLSASIWTGDLGRAHRVSDAVKAGIVWTNTIFEMDPMAPFGGYKQSGLGRELGPGAIDEFTQIKTAHLRW